MSLIESYKKEEGEAVQAAEDLNKRIVELEELVKDSDTKVAVAVLELEDAKREIETLESQPLVPGVVDLSPVVKALADLKAQVASLPPPSASDGSDQANWDKLWVALANIMAKMSKFEAFVDNVSNRFGI